MQSIGASSDNELQRVLAKSMFQNQQLTDSVQQLSAKPLKS
jgi:hypothetical protein